MTHIHYHPGARHDEREEQLRWERQVREHEREWARSARQRADRVEALRSIHHGDVPRAEWEAVLEDPEPTDPEQRDSWWARRSLAEQVLAREVSGYADALRVCRCMSDLVPHVGKDGMSLELHPESVTVTLDAPSSAAMRLPDGVVVAMQELTRTADHRLYQDYVAGLALRAARDVMSVLLVDDVIVDVVLSFSGVDERGRPTEPIRTRALSVPCPRAAMESFDWSSCDASDTIELLAHEMRFSPTDGFRDVPQITRE